MKSYTGLCAEYKPLKPTYNKTTALLSIKFWIADAIVTQFCMFSGESENMLGYWD